MGRTPRAEIIQAIYDDLDYAAIWFPKERTSLLYCLEELKKRCMGLKARAALARRNKSKISQYFRYQLANHLTIAAAAMCVMAGAHVVCKLW
jgi:hypothetical protein